MSAISLRSAVFFLALAGAAAAQTKLMLAASARRRNGEIVARVSGNG
jgi:hypothetical protein